MVGLVTSDEINEIENRKQTPSMKTPRTTGQYSRQSGRWNETPKSPSRSRLLSRRASRNSNVSNHLFCVDEHEREVWVRIKIFSRFFFSFRQYQYEFSLDASSTLSNLTN